MDLFSACSSLFGLWSSLFDFTFSTTSCTTFFCFACYSLVRNCIMMWTLFSRLRLFIGIGFNITSINLLLTDVTEMNFVFPFVAGAPLSLFWTILCIILPIFKKNFFSQFAFMPIAIYDETFYDGLGHDPNNTSIHPFAKRFKSDNSFFQNTSLILIILVISASKLPLQNSQNFHGSGESFSRSCSSFF